MNSVQEYILGFLKEFDQICREQGIRYTVNNETLLYGVCKGEIPPIPYKAEVLMTADNCRKFIDHIRKNPKDNRDIEYWGNSKRYPTYTVRYVATDTTSFHILDYMSYEKHGIFIEIQILRSKKLVGKMGKICRAEQTGFLIDSYSTTIGINSKSDKKARRSWVFYRLSVVFLGRQGIRKRVFDYMTSKAKKPTSLGKGKAGVYVYAFGDDLSPDISANYFRKESEVNIGGYAFPAPCNKELYLKYIYKGRVQIDFINNQMTVKDNLNYAEKCIVDIDTGYEKLISDIGLNNAELKALYKNKIINDELVAKNMITGEHAAADWNSVRQTDYRFRLWEEYLPIKEDIKKDYEEGNFTRLNEIFEPYESALKSLPKSMPFAFDNELLEIYIKLLLHNGYYGRANMLLMHMPNSHLQKIDSALLEEKK